jgi:hypothetical protein
LFSFVVYDVITKGVTQSIGAQSLISSKKFLMSINTILSFNK